MNNFEFEQISKLNSIYVKKIQNLEILKFEQFSDLNKFQIWTIFYLNKFRI
jgi:plasmid replication initiation protein